MFTRMRIKKTFVYVDVAINSFPTWRTEALITGCFGYVCTHDGRIVFEIAFVFCTKVNRGFAFASGEARQAVANRLPSQRSIWLPTI